MFPSNSDPGITTNELKCAHACDTFAHSGSGCTHWALDKNIGMCHIIDTEDGHFNIGVNRVINQDYTSGNRLCATESKY